jgi:hypothetical protein
MEYDEGKELTRLVLGGGGDHRGVPPEPGTVQGQRQQTPFEVWYGKTPAVHHLKTFGCVVYVRNTKPHLKKLDDKGRKMIFVGYERGTKAYKAYDPITRRVTISRDVIFDEEAIWD